MKHLILVLALAFQVGCATSEKTSESIAGSPCADGIQAAPSWELASNDGQVNQKAKPERRAWSTAAYEQVSKYWGSFVKAKKDLIELDPSFESRTEPQQKTVVVEMLSTVAEYEASWGADHFSKDVNGKSDEPHLATGLFQMNTLDQGYYKTGTKYTHAQLKEATKNIEVAVKIIDYLVKSNGKIIYNRGDKSPIIGYFFATLLRDAPYGMKTIAATKKHIANLKFQECK